MHIDKDVRFHSKGGDKLFHYMGVSAFAQYTVLHQESVAVIDKKAPLEKVNLLGCGLVSVDDPAAACGCVQTHSFLMRPLRLWL